MSINNYNKSRNKPYKQKYRDAFDRHFLKKEKKYDKNNLAIFKENFSNKHIKDDSSLNLEQDHKNFHKYNNTDDTDYINTKSYYSSKKKHNKKRTFSESTLYSIEKNILSKYDNNSKDLSHKKKSKRKKKDMDDLNLSNICNYDDYDNDNNYETISSRSKSKRNIFIKSNKRSIKDQDEEKKKIDKRYLRIDKLNVYGNIVFNINDGDNSLLPKGLKKLKYNDIDKYQNNEKKRYNESDNDDNDKYSKKYTSRSQSKLFKSNGKINEVATGLGGAIPDNIIRKLFHSIVKIVSHRGQATGFFMKIKKNDKEIKCLFTCNHVILKEDLENEINIVIYFGDKEKEHHRVLQLNNNKRFMRAFQKEDVTMIEIIDEDRLSSDKYYLVPAFNYKDKSIYYHKNLYLGGYPVNHKERCVSSGRITGIKNNIFYHNIDTRPGSSGSPIINDEGHVIGIHTSGIKEYLENVGIFIGKILDILKIDGGKNNKVNMDKQEPFKDKILQKPDPLYSFLPSPKTPVNSTSYQYQSPQSPKLTLSPSEPSPNIIQPIEVSLSPPKPSPSIKQPLEVSLSPSNPSPNIMQIPVLYYNNLLLPLCITNNLLLFISLYINIQ